MCRGYARDEGSGETVAEAEVLDPSRKRGAVHFEVIAEGQSVLEDIADVAYRLLQTSRTAAPDVKHQMEIRARVSNKPVVRRPEKPSRL